MLKYKVVSASGKIFSLKVLPPHMACANHSIFYKEKNKVFSKWKYLDEFIAPEFFDYTIRKNFGFMSQVIK